MKTIGLIGGLSWISSVEYYRIINEELQKRLGGCHSAKNLMYSVDFAEIEKLQHEEKWEEATAIMIDAAKRLEKGGADFVIICANTMHKMADDIQNNVKIPLLNIIDVTAEEIKLHKLQKIGLLGTKFTMEQDFYKARLIDKYKFEVVVPNKKDQKLIHNVLYSELGFGKINKSSKDQFVRIINDLIINGAEGVILGCTEIPLLIQQKNVKCLVFDTTRIHAEAAVNFSLK